MNRSTRFLLAAALGVVYAFAQVIPTPILNDDQVEKDSQPMRAYFASVRTLLNQEDFNQLDQLATEARASRERFTGGNWKLRDFYRVTQGPGYLTAPDATWNNHIERLQRWMAARPDSIAARVSLGSAYLRFAWKARGNGFADTVTPEGWVLFKARIQQARQVLEQAEALPTKDPQLYCALQTVALAQGWSRPEIDRLLTQEVAVEPLYFYIYDEQVNYLMPKWHGKPGEAEAFAQSVADQNSGDQGNFMYYRIAQSENCCRKTQLPALSWERTKLGFSALERLYGSTNYQRNAMAYMAIKQNDHDLARQLFTQIRADWNAEVWKTKANFDASRIALDGAQPDQPVAQQP